MELATKLERKRALTNPADGGAALTNLAQLGAEIELAFYLEAIWPAEQPCRQARRAGAEADLPVTLCVLPVTLRIQSATLESGLQAYASSLQPYAPSLPPSAPRCAVVRRSCLRGRRWRRGGWGVRWRPCRPCASYCTTHYSLLWLDLLLHSSLWHYSLWLQLLVKRQPKCVPALARLAELKLEARHST